MKKAKSAAKKAKKKASSNNADHCFLVIDDKHTLPELAKQNRYRFEVLSSAIRQLMAVHNSLIDTLKAVNPSNEQSVRRAAFNLECDIDNKIEIMNNFLDHAFEGTKKNESQKTRKSKKPRKKAPKKNVRKKGTR